MVDESHPYWRKNMQKDILFKIITLSGLIFFSSSSFSETINVLSYHIHPPFVTSDGQGLTYDLVEILNQQSENKYQFKVQKLPRKRLDLKIKVPGPWIVLWVNPAWFGDKLEKKYKWINILKDKNAIISHMNKKVEYNSYESLEGMKFGGILGHKYLGIDDLVKAGKINRIDGVHERNNIDVLLKQRVDVILLPDTTIRYYFKRLNLSSKLYISKKPHQKYWRKFMISKTREDLINFISKISLDSNKKWSTSLKKYGINE